MTDTDLLTVIREALRIGSVSHDGDPWFATDAGFGSSDEAGEKIAAGFAALDALAATPAPLMDIQKQSVVTTAPLDVPGHVHPGHILCAACVNNGMSAASAAERPATPNSYEKWIRPKVAATPAPLDVLVAALEAIDAKVQKYAEQEADSAAHKEWTLADRWRYLAMGNAEAVESIRAAHKENRGE